MARLNEKSFRCKNLLGDVVTVKPHWKSVKHSTRGKTRFRDRYIDVPHFGLKAVVKACGRGEEVRCPVRWYCKKLDRIIVVSEDAFPDPKYGFICDCGQWVKQADSLHTDFIFDVRVII
jgi:hypothetical protein